jgi:hypothetical protein
MDEKGDFESKLKPSNSWLLAFDADLIKHWLVWVCFNNPLIWE